VGVDATSLILIRRRKPALTGHAKLGAKLDLLAYGMKLPTMTENVSLRADRPFTSRQMRIPK
jgi:hypothetical protein